ncbi:unnamed protein product [Linum trigynum]|uniref:Uncharacterized protein n=1 Tax=Linum trigynum TaxID=586398 RepID=A0AAV2DEA8_9ROSI
MAFLRREDFKAEVAGRVSTPDRVKNWRFRRKLRSDGEKTLSDASATTNGELLLPAIGIDGSRLPEFSSSARHWQSCRLQRAKKKRTHRCVKRRLRAMAPQRTQLRTCLLLGWPRTRKWFWPNSATATIADAEQRRHRQGGNCRG